jgi:hypothetical protein
VSNGGGHHTMMNGGDLIDELQRELVEKNSQIGELTGELETVTARALDDAGRYAEILAARDAAARSAQKHVIDLRK